MLGGACAYGRKPRSPQHGAVSRRCGVVPTRRAGAPPAGPPTPTYHPLYSCGRLADAACARVYGQIIIGPDAARTTLLCSLGKVSVLSFTEGVYLRIISSRRFRVAASSSDGEHAVYCWTSTVAYVAVISMLYMHSISPVSITEVKKWTLLLSLCTCELGLTSNLGLTETCQ